MHIYIGGIDGLKSVTNLLYADLGIDIQEIRTWGFWRRF